MCVLGMCVVGVVGFGEAAHTHVTWGAMSKPGIPDTLLRWCQRSDKWGIVGVRVCLNRPTTLPLIHPGHGQAAAHTQLKGPNPKPPPPAPHPSRPWPSCCPRRKRATTSSTCGTLRGWCR